MHPPGSRAGGRDRAFPRVPHPGNAREFRLPEGEAFGEFHRGPVGAFRRAPARIGQRQRGQRFAQAHEFLHVREAEILDEHPQRPAVRHGVVDREQQHVVVRGAPQQQRAVERALQEVEGAAEVFRRDLVDRLVSALRRFEFAVLQVGFALAPDHLERLRLAGQERQAKRLLPVHDAAQRRFRRREREASPHVDQRADVVGGVAGGHRRRLPEFALGKGQRLERGFPALQPPLEDRAFVHRHGSLTAARRRGRWVRRR